ncbi:MAG TPA: GNAT family N-acetyltransferase [Dehalococcoidia bacterium]|jgi:GNAT superfamily N-acetyltransferase|nr:GNAT family N-acetyltransferase [Dehalococcoidia bacterium]
MTASGRVRGGVWARGHGVTLSPFDGALSDGLAQALRDGVERGYEGDLPASPPGTVCMVVRVDGADVGLLAFEVDLPLEGAATVHAIAIDPDQRGHAYGTHALFAAERRLRRDGADAFFARVPRTNGRGLYFMLRASYAPITAPAALPDDDATWFRRFED